MVSYQLGLSNIHYIKKQKDQLLLITASNESVKDLLRQETLEQPKSVQLDEILYKWFTGIHPDEKPITGPMIIVINCSAHSEI